MPIEIRELVIKVAIEERQQKPAIGQEDLQELKNRIVKECTEKILAKLHNLSER